MYIRNTNEKTAGKYKCEVSVEGTFHTVAAEKMMMVFSKFSRVPIFFIIIIVVIFFRMPPQMLSMLQDRCRC